MQPGDPRESAIDAPPRRSFLVRFTAGLLGGILAVFPFAAGFGVLFHPLRRGPGKIDDDSPLDKEKLVPIGPLDVLPADGVPHPFVVIADVADAWTRHTGQRIGTVFLTRRDVNGKPKVTAFSATCPHLGCAVEFAAAANRFECPCHASAFGKDGKKLFGPSLRGLDELAVKLIENGGQTQIWIAYEKFLPGIAERKSP